MPCPGGNVILQIYVTLFLPSAGRCFLTACVHLHLTLGRTLATGQLSVVPGCLGDCAGQAGQNCCWWTQGNNKMQSESLGLRAVRLWDVEATVNCIYLLTLSNEVLFACSSACSAVFPPGVYLYPAAGIRVQHLPISHHHLSCGATQQGFQEQVFLPHITDRLWCKSSSPAVTSHYKNRYLLIISVKWKYL